MSSSSHLCASRTAQAPSILRQALRTIALTVALWQERARARRSLRELNGLDDHALRDIGTTRGQINFEASKMFWEP